MRNTDERVKAAILGAEKYRRLRKKRQRQLAVAGAATLSVCLIILVGIAMPPLLVEDTTSVTAGVFGSVFGNSEVLSYIMIGLLAFVLGVFTTVLCMLLHKKGEEQDDDD